MRQTPVLCHNEFLSIQDIKLKALIEMKSLKLKVAQAALRRDAAREHKLLQSCQPEVLMDWGLCRLANPDHNEPDMLYQEPAPVIPVSRISQTAQLELARCSSLLQADTSLLPICHYSLCSWGTARLTVCLHLASKQC